MKKKISIVMLSIILLIGCQQTLPVRYTYRSNDRQPIFSKDAIKKHRTFGVAIVYKDGKRDTVNIEAGINKYFHDRTKENALVDVRYTDIGRLLDLDDNLSITNADQILAQYPDMRYALYVWEGESHFGRRRYDESNVIEKKGNEKTVTDKIYKNTLSIQAEFVLYDLADNIMLARAADDFAYSNTHTKNHLETGNTMAEKLITTVRELHYLSSTDEEINPDVTLSDVEKLFEDYIFYFLKNINHTTANPGT